MLKRRRTDPPFLRENLEAGLAAGAALEVDLVRTADGHFVCLHDVTLDRETTGAGPAAALARDEVERLRQRAVDGGALNVPPLFLDEIVTAVSRHSPWTGQVQLDLKEPWSALDEDAIHRLRATLGSAASAFVIGTTDAAMYTALRSLVPDIGLGFDPLQLHEEKMPVTSAEFEALADETVGLGPEARIFYLNADLVLAGLAAGVNLVEHVRKGGAEVDAWTVDSTRPRVHADLRALLAAGCRQITTNEPDVLLPLLEEIA
jgi:glycerophosphoryl diester phosphodiesterase